MLDGHAWISVDIEESEIVGGRNQPLILAHVDRVDVRAVLAQGPGSLDVPSLLDRIGRPGEALRVLHPIVVELLARHVKVELLVSPADRPDVGRVCRPVEGRYERVVLVKLGIERVVLAHVVDIDEVIMRPNS